MAKVGLDLVSYIQFQSDFDAKINPNLNATFENERNADNEVESDSIYTPMFRFLIIEKKVTAKLQYLSWNNSIFLGDECVDYF